VEIIPYQCVEMSTALGATVRDPDSVPIRIVDLRYDTTRTFDLPAIGKIQCPGIVGSEVTACIPMNNKFEIASIRCVISQIAIGDIAWVLIGLSRRTISSLSGNIDAIKAITPIIVSQ